MMAEWARSKRLDAMVEAAKRMGALRLFLGGGPKFPELSAAQRASLRERFRPEIAELGEMLNRDLTAWT